MNELAAELRAAIEAAQRDADTATRLVRDGGNDGGPHYQAQAVRSIAHSFACLAQLAVIAAKIASEER